MRRLLYGSCRIVLITAVLAFAFIINAQAATIYALDDLHLRDATWLWSETISDDAKIKLYPTDLDGNGQEDILVTINAENDWDDRTIAKRGYNGEHLWERLGMIDFVLTGDLDGDGGADILYYDTTSNTITALSGFDGTELWDWYAWGVVIKAIPAGDVDGDGTKDVIVVEKSGLEVPIYEATVEDVNIHAVNGKNGSVIWTIDPWTMYSWGFSYSESNVSVSEVFAVEDLNNDGRDDIVVVITGVEVFTDPWGTFEHHYSSLIYVNSNNIEDPLGFIRAEGDFLSLTQTGDLDGDSINDIIIKSVTEWGDILTQAISVGEQNTLWMSRSLENSSIIPIGDLDGDGKSDLILIDFGEPEHTWDTTVVAKRGIDGFDLWKKDFWDFFTTHSGDIPFYVSVSPAGDLDGDGKEDVLINALYGEKEEKIQLLGDTVIAAVRGYDGHELWRVKEDLDETGYSALPAGDVDGDGVDDVLVRYLNYYSLAPRNIHILYAKRGYDGSDLWICHSYWRIEQFTSGFDLNGDYVNDAIVEFSYRKNGQEIHHISALIKSEITTRITPSYGPNITTVNTTIYGLGFTDGVDVRLVKDGEEDIRGEDVKVLSERQITDGTALT